MSFLADPIGNISGAIHDVGKSSIGQIAETAALAYFLGPAGGLGAEGAGLMGSTAAMGVGGGLTTLLNGGNLQDSLKSGLLSAGIGSLTGVSDTIGATSIPGGAPDAPGIPTPVDPIAQTGVNATANVANDLAPQAQIAAASDAAPPVPPPAAPPTAAPPTAAPPTAAPPTAAPPTAAPPAAPPQTTTLWQDFKALPNWEKAAIGVGGIGLLKGANKQAGVTAPKYAGKIAYFGGNQFSGPSNMYQTTAATGGLVALAKGGGVHHYDDGGNVNPAASTAASAPVGSSIAENGHLMALDGTDLGVPQWGASVKVGSYIGQGGRLMVPDGGQDDNGNASYTNMGVPQGPTVQTPANPTPTVQTPANPTPIVQTPANPTPTGIASLPAASTAASTLPSTTPVTATQPNNLVDGSYIAGNGHLLVPDGGYGEDGSATYTDMGAPQGPTVQTPANPTPTVQTPANPTPTGIASLPAASTAASTADGSYIAGNGDLLVPDGGYDENGSATYTNMGVPQGGASLPAASTAVLQQNAAQQPAAPATPAAPDTSATPQYTSYTDQQIKDYFAQNPEANFALAEQQLNADPNQVNTVMEMPAVLHSTLPDATPVTAIDPSSINGSSRTAQIDGGEDENGNASYTDMGAPQPSTTDNTGIASLPAASTAASTLPSTTTANAIDPTSVNGNSSAATAPSTPGYISNSTTNPTSAPSVGGSHAFIDENGYVSQRANQVGQPLNAQGFLGNWASLQQMKDAYTKAGGSLGATNPAAPAATTDAATQHILDMLSGKIPASKVPYTPTGEIFKPYYTSVMGMAENPVYTISQPTIFDPTSKKYVTNPNYDPNFSATADYIGAYAPGYTGKAVPGLSQKTLDYLNQNGVSSYGTSTTAATSLPSTNASGQLVVKGQTYPTGSYIASNGHLMVPDGGQDGNGQPTYNDLGVQAAGGGLMGLAAGGVGHLGGYSDGGRLLRGPGDGVSDSIPATIGSTNPEPARLADGEFVVPARIVSELGNGSTEAGARQLYKMMDRIQNTRRKTVGKNAVATNTNAHQYLPA